MPAKVVEDIAILCGTACVKESVLLCAYRDRPPHCTTLKNASHRLGVPKAADITKARALAPRRGTHLKLTISYGHELINWEMSLHDT